MDGGGKGGREEFQEAEVSAVAPRPRREEPGRLGEAGAVGCSSTGRRSGADAGLGKRGRRLRGSPQSAPGPLPAPPPGRLPRALQPSPLPAPEQHAAAASPVLSRAPGCSNLRKGLGLRTLKSRTTLTTALPPGRPKDLKLTLPSLVPKPGPASP